MVEEDGEGVVFKFVSLLGGRLESVTLTGRPEDYVLEIAEPGDQQEEDNSDPSFSAARATETT